MLNIKTLISAAATAALIGTIGLAYAQTTTDPMTTSPQNQPGSSQTQQSPQMPADRSTTTNTPDSSTQSADLNSERAAQADRN